MENYVTRKKWLNPLTEVNIKHSSQFITTPEKKSAISPLFLAKLTKILHSDINLRDILICFHYNKFASVTNSFLHFYFKHHFLRSPDGALLK